MIHKTFAVLFSERAEQGNVRCEPYLVQLWPRRRISRHSRSRVMSPQQCVTMATKYPTVHTSVTTCTFKWPSTRGAYEHHMVTWQLIVVYYRQTYSLQNSAMPRPHIALFPCLFPCQRIDAIVTSSQLHIAFHQGQVAPSNIREHLIQFI